MIRPAALDDLPAILRLAAQMHHEAPAYRGWSIDPEKVRALMAGLIGGAGCLLVAVVDDVLVGGVAGVCSEHWFSRELVASDLALFIEPAHRNGTTAARLVRGFVAWAELMGAKRVSLGVTTGVHPEATARLFAACGLKPAGYVFSKDF